MSSSSENPQISRWITQDDFLKRLIDPSESFCWFEQMGHALKFAIAIAIKNELTEENDSTILEIVRKEPEIYSNGYFNNYAQITSWDHDEYVKNLLIELFPERSNSPYKFAELLGKNGLIYMRDKIVNEGWDLLSFLD